MGTKIEWVKNADGTQGKTWNPVVGCSPASEGCRNCYAKALHDKRHKAWQDGWAHAPAQYVFPFNHVQLIEERLEEPLHWRKAQKAFVCSVADLFHESVPFGYIDKVFAVMELCPQHTFQLLTKRPERMRQYMADNNYIKLNGVHIGQFPPLPNVWLGCTAENQEQADKRIPLLLQTPAAVRFVSVEPMLGPLFIRRFLDRLDWIVCGGETGPSARPMHPDWPRALRDQCQAAGVPFFFKSWGNWKPISEMTEVETDALYHPASESDPEAARRCKVASRAVQYDGEDGFYVLDGHCGYSVFNVGKKAAGHLLDGREWQQMPEREAAPC